MVYNQPSLFWGEITVCRSWIGGGATRGSWREGEEGREEEEYMHVAHLTRMKAHFEFLKVVPLLGFTFFKIMVNIPCTEPKGMKFSVWSEEESGGCLLIAHSWISSLPFSHHVDTVWITREGERIPAVGCAEVDGRYHEVLVTRCVRRSDHARSDVIVVSVVSVVTIVAYVVIHNPVQRHFYVPRSIGEKLGRARRQVLSAREVSQTTSLRNRVAACK